VEVIDSAPGGWFLLGAGSQLYLDVNCNHHAFGYSVLIELDQHERARFDREGRVYLDELSRAVRDSAPGVDVRSPYGGRDLTDALGSEASQAVRLWRRAGR
jgi:hypothetical protein